MDSLTPSLDGFLLVNKPSGPTSYDVIRVVKRLIHGVKIGHCGTLDPIASGLLILLFGKSTKKQSFFMGQDKVYRAEIKLGVKTDTGDITGKILEEKPIPELSADVIRASFGPLLGFREQEPPMYSAVKVGGQPLYKLARKGQVIERKSRSIKIHSIDFLGWKGPGLLEIRVHCSSGTYIRVLAEEIAEQLGTVGTMNALVREEIGSFTLQEAVLGNDLIGATPEFLRERIRAAA